MASRKPRSVHQRAIARVLRTGNLWWMTLLKVDLQRNKKHLQNQKKRNKKKGVRNQNPQPLKQNMAFLPKASTPFLGVTKHKKTNNQRHCAGLQEGRCQRIHDLVKIVVEAVALQYWKIIVKIPLGVSSSDFRFVFWKKRQLSWKQISRKCRGTALLVFALMFVG